MITTMNADIAQKILDAVDAGSSLPLSTKATALFIAEWCGVEKA